MPSVLTGAALANRDLIYLGVSGDGDSASIGIGQFAHVMRRGVNMVYIVENNGVYGSPRASFPPPTRQQEQARRGQQRRTHRPRDARSSPGATFVARGFSGDKEQLTRSSRRR
jgi:2-oxoglutarate ferredoxin oxidoreductase subunit beta